MRYMVRGRASGLWAMSVRRPWAYGCLGGGRVTGLRVAGRGCLPEVVLRAGVCGCTHICVYSPTELHPELPGPADGELTELLHGLTHRHGLRIWVPGTTDSLCRTPRAGIAVQLLPPARTLRSPALFAWGGLLAHHPALLALWPVAVPLPSLEKTGLAAGREDLSQARPGLGERPLPSSQGAPERLEV